MVDFMDDLAYGSRQSWRDLCDKKPPQVGENGYLIGPWGDAILAAAQAEKRGDHARYADGPCGQVLDYLSTKGYQGKILKAAQDTEGAAHSGVLRASHQHGKSGATDPRPVCKYGPSCYRKNPDHLKEFAHPWLDSSSGASGGGYSQSGKGGGKSGKPPSERASAQMKLQCGSCRNVMQVAIPAEAPPGSLIEAQCTQCGQQNQGPTPHVAQVGSSRPAPKITGRPPIPSGRQKALLVGINYFGTRAQLRGCINDVKNIHNLLTRQYGWDQKNIRTLTDDNRDRMPTRANITKNLRWLAQDARPGDVLFLSFSGHGAQQEDPHGYEEDGMNETILPVDFERAGQISDDEIADMITRHLPEGVKLTCVMDCCHSGTGLDLSYTWTGRGWKEETNPYHCLADVQMFSGCEDDDTSSDASTAYGAAGGAMTTAFCNALRSNPGPSYPELMSLLHQNLRREGFRQRPQLTSSQPFEFDRPFILSDIIPNMNPQIGRIFRRKFPPRPRRMEGPLGEMLGIGVAVMGGMMLGDMIGGMLFG